MKVKNKKSVLIAIIILLTIILPLGVTGMVLQLQKKNDPSPVPEVPSIPQEENPNHEFFYEGSLYFYDNDELIGTYKCENSNCDYAMSTYDDKDYPIESFEEATTKTSLIAKRYAFLTDSSLETETDNIILYDLKNQEKVAEYRAVKNYGIGIENNQFIVKNTLNQWGVITVNETGSKISIPLEYDFIGLIDDQKDGVIASEKYIVSKNNLWSIIGSDQSTYVSDLKEMIVTYNGKHIVTKKDNLYFAKTYEGIDIFKTGCNHLSFTGKYINITDQNNRFYVYDSDTNKIISKDYLISPTDTITSKINGQTLQIILNDNIVETINI